jgi:Arc/MetJ-type ribon-helix-helix transcriptional regulator
MRTAKIVSISLPPDIQDEVNQIAKEERRSISEVMREAFRQYAATRVLSTVRKQAKKTNKKLKLKPQDIENLIDQGRK